MPELPDIELYLHALRSRIVGQVLDSARIFVPFLVKTFEPPLGDVVGTPVVGLRRIGKRIVWEFPEERFVVIHLMIAGRFLWQSPTPNSQPFRPGGKSTLAQFRFSSGQLLLTEASTKHRAALHVLKGEAALREQDPGGLDPLGATPPEFSEALLAENRTLKRALTNPHRFSGIGNAYSDEILHAAKLSPVRLTRNLKEDEILRLYDATQSTLTTWSQKLIQEFQGKFPGKGQVTAFRPDFAVHGKYGKPCPVCGKPVQRIQYAENEANYCAQCQNEGRLLADRSLSRLLKDDWPATLDELLE